MNISEQEQLEWENRMHPTLLRIIQEAGEINSDDDPAFDEKSSPDEQQEEVAPSEGGGLNIEQLAADFQQGNLQKEDLIRLYQGGQLTQEEIGQIMGMSQEDQEPGSEEELLNQQITQTSDLFVKFALYDKVTELTEKLNYFKENFDDIQSDVYNRVLQLDEFLNILSNLIFNVETSISYQMYGSILLQLTELFNEYNQSQITRKAQEEAENQQMSKEKDGDYEND